MEDKDYMHSKEYAVGDFFALATQKTPSESLLSGEETSSFSGEDTIYSVFYNNLPGYMQRELDRIFDGTPYMRVNESTLAPLPTVTTLEEAEIVLGALEQSWNAHLPHYANPFKLAKNRPEAKLITQGLTDYYKSLLLMLGTYFPRYSSFHGLATLVYMHFPRYRSGASANPIQTPLDCMFKQIKTGQRNVKDEVTGEWSWKPSTLRNFKTHTDVKDYPRDSDGNLAPEADLALFCYENYGRARLELRKTFGMESLARYALLYTDKHTHIIGLETVDTDKEEPMMNADNLYMLYHEYLEDGLEFNLFERLRIESLLEYVNSPTAQDAQKQKYLLLLENAIKDAYRRTIPLKMAAIREGQEMVFVTNLDEQLEMMNKKEAKREKHMDQD